MCHGYVDDWWDKFRNEKNPIIREKMMKKRENERKVFRKKYKNMSLFEIECDQILKGEGIFGETRKIVECFRKFPE